MKTVDKNGDIFIGDTVEVGEPLNGDLHNFPFTGTVVSFGGGFIIVEDMEGERFTVDCYNVEFVS